MSKGQGRAIGNWQWTIGTLIIINHNSQLIKWQ